MRHVPMLERMIVDSGIKLIKLYFSVSQKEQLRRFQSRSSDPLKQWKVSPVDISSIDKWREYTEGEGGDVPADELRGRPVDHRQVRRQEKGAYQRDASPHKCHGTTRTKDPAVAYAPDPSIVAYSHEVYTAGAPIQ